LRNLDFDFYRVAEEGRIQNVGPRILDVDAVGANERPFSFDRLARGETGAFQRKLPGSP
jgi:hypothetical protein